MKIIRIDPNLLKTGIIFLALFSMTIPLVNAQSPLPTEISQEIKEKVRERIEQIQEEFKKRAFFGTLKEITNSNLTLDTPKGERRVKTSKETKFFDAGRKEIKFEDLEIGNFIIALGYEQENETLEAKRIIALKKPPKPTIKRYAVYGRVADISEEEKVFSLVHPNKPETTFEIMVGNSTIITKKVEGKIKKVDFSEIEIGDRLICVGTKMEKNETLIAKLIHVIPGKASGPKEKTITPTPTPKKPTPSLEK